MYVVVTFTQPPCGLTDEAALFMAEGITKGFLPQLGLFLDANLRITTRGGLALFDAVHVNPQSVYKLHGSRRTNCPKILAGAARPFCWKKVCMVFLRPLM